VKFFLQRGTVVGHFFIQYIQSRLETAVKKRTGAWSLRYIFFYILLYFL
jgi:hypothetical protein